MNIIVNREVHFLIMEKTNKNEELQSRREFFKKAAKGALPILAAVALASAPNIINAARNESPCACAGGCVGGCSYTCGGTCKGACMNYCQGTCKNTCKNGTR